METNPKIYKLIKKFITREIKGSDVFIHNGSKWLIFEEDKKWVIELTKEGTLWYNYYFFENIFELVDLDVIENQYYITKWVEDNIINGVKESRALEEWVNSEEIVDKTIKNGVKDTFLVEGTRNRIVEDAIQNGIKETKHNPFEDGLAMEEVIQNGVKETTPGGYLGFVEMRGTTVHQFETAKQLYYVEDVINDGVKETWGYEKQPQMRVNNVINDGIKIK